METLVSSVHALSPLAAGVLIASIWQGVLLTLGLALALWVLRSVPAGVRASLWSGALVLVVLLPVLAVVLPQRGVAGHAELHMGQDWSVAILAVWGTLSALRAVSLGWNGFRLWRLARRATPVRVDAAVTALLRGRRRAELCVSDEVNRPSVAGFFRPRVLLPTGLLETLSSAELQHLVLHEMEHLRRGDDWLNLLQQVSLVLLPLNPALVWLDRRLCRERELACDDGVLRQTEANKAYAACLVKLAEDSLVRKGFALALSALGSRARESELVGRVRRILAGPERVVAPGRVRLAVVTVAAVMMLSAGVLARSPRMVSFDGSSAEDVARSSEPVITRPEAHALPVLAVAERGSGRTVMAKAVVGGPVAERAVGRAHAVMAVAVSRRRNTVQPLRTRAVAEPGAAWRMADAKAVVTKAAGARKPLEGGTPALRPVFWEKNASPERVFVTEFEVLQPVFAAVPVQGGWLVVQL
jgi:hypothetical protein